MAKPEAIAAEYGAERGLQKASASDDWYGNLDGYLVQLSVVERENSTKRILILIRYDEGEAQDSVLKEAVAADAGLAAMKVKPKEVGVESGFLAHEVGGKMKSFGLSGKAPTIEELRERFETLFELTKRNTTPPAPSCAMCETDEPGPPRLLEGVVVYTCQECIDQIHAEMQAAQAAYDAKPTRYTFALTAAVLTGVLGAVIWAGVGIVTGYMHVFVAAGIGLMIGGLTGWAAGKGGLVVQAMGFVFTILSVLLGELLWVAYQTNELAEEEGGEVDWNAFIQAAPEILWANGEDTIFSMLFACAGAVVAASMTAKKTFAANID